MSIEGLTATLEERGLIWQGSGFALIGAGSLLVLSVYSEAGHWSIDRLAVTQLNWAFVVAIALAIEGIRRMFRNKNRNPAKRLGERYIAKEVEKRLKSIADEPGVVFPPELELKLFKNDRGHKWWHHLPPFR